MTAPALTLYHFATCPYCARVRRALADLDLEIELRDIHADPAALDALVRAQGRPTVPVLHIRDEDEPRWMPESADIVTYLYDRFGQGRSPPLSLRIHPQVWIAAAVVLLIIVLRMLS
ncbi:MAG: glutaredoxin [Myxococcota bacterium]